MPGAHPSERSRPYPGMTSDCADKACSLIARRARITALCLAVAVGVVSAEEHSDAPDGVGSHDSSEHLADHGNDGVVVSNASAIINERSITSRVLGGGDAEPDEYPSVVALVRAGTRALENRIFCGGTVVADRWVMTAAHCLYDSAGRVEIPSTIRVVAGVTDLRNDAFADEVIVTSLFIHPEYDNSLELPPNDIALLELANVVDVSPTDLFAKDTTLYTGSMGFVAGWGAMQFESDFGFDFPTRLQDASVPLVSLADCNSPASYNQTVTSRQLCAGFREGGIDTCTGDSGGPLFIQENGRSVQVGITSFGNGCGLPDFYGIYTDVSHFIQWLGNYIPVPSQSAELIAQREANEQMAGAASGDSDRRGLFGGAMHPLTVILLSLGAIMGRWLRVRVVLARTSRLKTGCLAVTLCMLSSGCAAYADKSHQADIGGPSEEQAVLNFSEHAGRAGIGDVYLGLNREDAFTAFTTLPVTLVTCQVQKTSLKGTGRLFLKETCVFEPAIEQVVVTLSVKQITAQFLDERLVGLEWVAIGQNLLPLTDQMNQQFEHPITAGRPFEWVSAENDAIRLKTTVAIDLQETVGEGDAVLESSLTDKAIQEAEAAQNTSSTVSVQLVEAALDGRLPAMFEIL